MTLTLRRELMRLERELAATREELAQARTMAEQCLASANAATAQLEGERLNHQQIHTGCHAERDALQEQLRMVDEGGKEALLRMAEQSQRDYERAQRLARALIRLRSDALAIVAGRAVRSFDETLAEADAALAVLT